MYKLGLGNKIIVLGAVFVVVGLITASAVTVKWGTDATGQSYAGYTTGMITNSNGKAWAASGANFQAAIYDLNGSGGSVFIPESVITFTDKLILINDVVISGCGSNSTLDFSAMDDDCIYINGNENILIEKLTIHGNSSGSGIHTGIAVRNSDNVSISHCRIYDTAYDGVFFLSGSNDCEILHSHIWNTGDDGINFGGNANGANRCKAIGNKIYTTTGTGVHVSAETNSSLVSDNIIIDCKNGIDFYKCQNITVSNNIVLNPTQYGISTQAGSNVELRDILIQGNQILGAASAAIYLNYGGNITISDNLIKKCASEKIKIDSVADIKINNNMIYCEDVGYGIWVTGTGVNNITIESNRIDNPDNQAVYVASTGIYHLQIKNNLIYNDADSYMIHIYSVNGAYKYGCVSGNSLNGGSRGINIGGPNNIENFVVSENILNSNSEYGVVFSFGSYHNTSCVVSDNIVEGSMTNAILFSNAGLNVISSNICDDTIVESGGDYNIFSNNIAETITVAGGSSIDDNNLAR